MKVLFTAAWGERLGGAETMLDTYLAALDRGRVDASVAFLRDGPWRRELEAAGIPVDVVPGGRLRDPVAGARTVTALARVVRRRRPDVVVNWSAKTHLYGAPACVLARRGCRVVWWQHNIPRPQWLDRLATRVPADAIGCSSHASAHRQATVAPRRRTLVVHPGVDVPEPRSARSATDGDVVVGLVGRLQAWKGQDLLLRALALLRDEGLPVRGVLVGGDAWGLSPGYVERLGELVDALGLADAVTLTGQVEDVWPHLEGMDVLVNASVGEPFGIVLVEAMAAGLPVVAPADGGPGEIVVDGETGLLVRDRTPEALARAIRRLVADGELRARLGAAGRARYETAFTAAAMARSLTAALERVEAGAA